MKIPVRARAILKKMKTIEQMERGKLCRMAGRPHYNLQSWQKGRNVVRYIPREQLASVRKALREYQTFMRLVDQYTEILIRKTRQQRAKQFAKSSKSPKKYLKSPKPA